MSIGHIDVFLILSSSITTDNIIEICEKNNKPDYDTITNFKLI